MMQKMLKQREFQTYFSNNYWKDCNSYMARNYARHGLARWTSMDRYVFSSSGWLTNVNNYIFSAQHAAGLLGASPGLGSVAALGPFRTSNVQVHQPSSGAGANAN